MLSILDIVSANTIYYCYPALVPTSKRVYGDSAVSEKIQMKEIHTLIVQLVNLLTKKCACFKTLETHTQKRKTLARFLYILLYHIIISISVMRKNIFCRHTHFKFFFRKPTPHTPYPPPPPPRPRCVLCYSAYKHTNTCLFH